MRRTRASYQCFKMGYRVAEQAMGLFPLDSELGEAVRHSLKNIALSSALEWEPGVCSVDGVIHVPGGPR